MKLPKKVLVKGKYYKIKQIKDLVHEEHADGLCLQAKREIHLDSKIKNDDLKRTLYMK